MSRLFSGKKFFFIFLFALLFSLSWPQGRAVKGKIQPLPPGLEATVARVMKTFEVPGIALAIVKDGSVLLARGYGVRRLGEPTPVDSRTLFGIASNTKLFTATGLGILVDEGRVAWDAPVINYLPWFQMWDPYVTRELTIRDLLSHRCGLGLGAGDLLWWPPSDYERREIVKRLRFIPPASSFRSTYAYNNLMFLAAGEVIEAVSGQSWEDFITQRILQPVGMKGTSARVSDLQKEENVATPHAPVEGVVRVVKPFLRDNINPAGGIISNAEDMALWVITQLNEGRLDGARRLFSEKVARDLATIITPRQIPEIPAELAAVRPNFSGYGLGVGIRDYCGWKILQHTGGLPGYLSQVTMVPELELGIVVLTNQESSEAYNALTNTIIDYYLGRPATDWVAAYLKVRERQEAELKEAEKKAEVSRDRSSRPSLPLERYAGTYNDAWYGDVEITWTGEKLRIRFTHNPALEGDLEHWQYDTFIARWDDRELRADAYITFSLNPDGTIEQAKMKAVSPATDFSFDFHDLLLRPVRPRK